MKGRTGVVVLGLVAIFIAGAILLRPTRRENPAPVAKPAEVVEIPPRPAPQPPPPPADEAPAEPAQGLVIEVVNREGKPVAGARVLQKWRFEPHLGTTNEAGLVVLSYGAINWEDRTRKAQLRFEHDAYAPHFEKVRRSDVRVRIALRASAIVDLEVVNKSNAPIGDAEVRVDEMESGFLSHPAHPDLRMWKTDDRGRARLVGIPAGALVVRAQAKGYEEGRTFAVVQEGEPHSVRVVLSPGRRLIVTVRTPTGEPAANAKVEFSDGSTWGMSSSPTTGYRTHYWTRNADKSGTASFDFIPASMAKGWVRAKLPSQPKVSKQIDLAPEVTETELTLQTGGALSIDVVDPEGRSVACKVTVTGPGMDASDSVNQKEKAAGEKALFDGLPAGLQLQVAVYRHSGVVHVEPGVQVIPSQTRDLTIRLPAQCRVKVSARDKQGAPVTGTVVLARVKGSFGPPVSGIRGDYLAFSSRTGEDGTAELSVFVGLYTLQFDPFEGSRVLKEFRIDGDLTVDVEVISEMTLTGIVVDSGEAPLAGVGVAWRENNANWITLTGPDGRYTLRRVLGGPGKLYVGFGGASVEVYAGTPSPAEQRHMYPMSTIRGRVVLPSGEPGCAIVYFNPVTPNYMGGESIPPLSTRRDGTFEIRLPSRMWHVTIFGEDANPNPTPVQVDLSSPGNIVDVEFPLPPAKSP